MKTPTCEIGAAKAKVNRAARKSARRAAALVGTALVCLAGPALRAQTDPLDHWTLRNPLPPSSRYWLNSIAEGNGQFVAVGGGGAIVTSPDGVTWTVSSPGVVGRLSGVTYGSGRFVAVGWNGMGPGGGGGRTIVASPDGVVWAAITGAGPGPISGPSDWEGFFGITYGKGQFVAVGGRTSSGLNGGPYPPSGWPIATSPDGVAWTPTNGPAPPSALNAIAYGDGQFVAVGWSFHGLGGEPATILSSPDGVAWTERSSATNSWDALVGVAYGNGQFVAVGDSGTILTSTDAVAWTERNSGTGNFLYGVAYGNGQFVAVGNGGTIVTSPDGVAWTAHNPGGSVWPKGIGYGNGQFVAVGWDALGSGAPILTSPDGVAWTPRSAGTDRGLNAIAYGDGQFVAVGDFGTILGCQVAARAPRLALVRSGGTTTISFATFNGASYDLLYTNSAGLGAPPASWPVRTNVAAGDGTIKSVTDTTADASRFFRLSVHQ